MKPNRHVTLQISTFVVTTACFLVMSGAWLFAQNLRKVLTYWGEDIQMTVYLQQDLSEDQQTALSQKIKSSGPVQSITLVNQEKALNDFRQQMASYAPDLSQDEELYKLIPSSFQIALDPTLSTQDQVRYLHAMSASIKRMEGVEEVSYGQSWIEKYSAFVNFVQVMSLGLAAIIVLAAVFVISNVIRSLIHSKREEIEVMELIGATASRIRRPFLIQGGVLGLSSALVSLALCFLLFTFARSVIADQLNFLRLSGQVEFFSYFSMVVFVMSGFVLGVLGSYICVRQINTGWAAARET